jgi:hypothetical protein
MECWSSQRRKWWDRKPSSVYSLVRADGHLSGIAVASHLVRPTRSSNDPGRVSLLIWPCSDRGLPCHACCQARGGLLPHRFTLTLWIRGRSVFCGPVPSPHGAQALPGGLPSGARTFLDEPLKPVHRDHRSYHFLREEVTGQRGSRARLQRVMRRIRRPMLSLVARSSQNPSCSPNTSARGAGGAIPNADKMKIPRSR